MYDTWSKIKKPENLDAKIWRYVDFAKFLSLIMSESLFFCRIDKLDDPFEGYYTYQDLYIQRERYKNAFLEQGFDGDIDKFIDTLYRRGLNERHSGRAILWDLFFWVNCWHLNENESVAMWEIYAGKNKGIAIESTFNRLCQSFDNKDPELVDVGMVEYNYDDSETTAGSPIYHVLKKRKCFEYEQEVRAILVAPTTRTINGKSEAVDLYPEGRKIKVDINKLIKKIHISPTAQHWFIDLVTDVVNHFGVHTGVVQSNIWEPPKY